MRQCAKHHKLVALDICHMAAVSIYVIGAVQWKLQKHSTTIDLSNSMNSAVFSFDSFIKRSKLEVGGNLNRRFLIVEAAVFRRMPALNEKPC